MRTSDARKTDRKPIDAESQHFTCWQSFADNMSVEVENYSSSSGNIVWPKPRIPLFFLQNYLSVISKGGPQYVIAMCMYTWVFIDIFIQRLHTYTASPERVCNQQLFGDLQGLFALTFKA